MRSATKSAKPNNTAVGETGLTRSPGQPGSANERLYQADLLAIIERQGERCALTGRQLQPEVANIDHLVPVIRGGRHAADNVQILHRDVNRAKGSLTQAEFIALCREVVAHADRQAKEG